MQGFLLRFSILVLAALPPQDGGGAKLYNLGIHLILYNYATCGIPSVVGLSNNNGKYRPITFLFHIKS